jgi:hypothetical protein
MNNRHPALTQKKRAVIVYQPQRILWCPTFNDYRVHKLSADRNYYICTCGEVLDYSINAAPEGKAIKTS